MEEPKETAGTEAKDKEQIVEKEDADGNVEEEIVDETENHS